MNRRSYMKAAVASGVLGASFTSRAGATNNEGGESSNYDSDIRDSRGTALADQLVNLSTEELRNLSNEDVKRPFNPEIGGGDTYKSDVTSDDADYRASSHEELQAALEQAGKGDVVWIPGDATIDAQSSTEPVSYYGSSQFIVPDGVTIASDRGQDGSDGAALVKDEADFGAAMRVVGDDVRITGLRFVGPEPEYYTLDERGVDSIYSVGTSMGVWLEGASDYDADPIETGGDGIKNIEVDNCHFSGFIYNCMRVGGQAWLGSPPTTNVSIHHNEFVDTPSPGLGYGVSVGRESRPVIENNYFDNNRHAIAGAGYSNMGYVARANLFGPRTRSHVIDMHENGDYAGESLLVENNVVLATGRGDTRLESVKIRGTPKERSTVRWNWFFNDHIFQLADSLDEGPAVEQYVTPVGEFENVVVYNNIMGKVNLDNAVGVSAHWEPENAEGRNKSD